MERVEARFSGHVQGVGFRYTAQELAGRYALFGYVQNLPNGDVEVVVEGENTADYLAELHKLMGRYITSQTTEKFPPTGEFITKDIGVAFIDLDHAVGKKYSGIAFADVKVIQPDLKVDIGRNYF